MLGLRHVNVGGTRSGSDGDDDVLAWIRGIEEEVLIVFTDGCIFIGRSFVVED